VPCEGGISPLAEDQVKKNLNLLNGDWNYLNGALVQKYTFKTFKDSLTFVNKIANLAEQEGHHPDIEINYNKVTLSLITHAIKGLSENDFILAAKADLIFKSL
jgi:4a-hydroxytetrahydrobiopterin dehydratase